MNTNDLTQKNAKKFECLLCDLFTCNKTDYFRHLDTEKHKQRSILTNTNDLTQKNALYVCECGKSYKHKPSLYNHKKKCDYKENQLVLLKKEEEENYKEIIKELKNIILEQNNTIKDLIPKIGNNNNFYNNNITNNQNFNITLFLNEKCPDALTIEQFINQIEVSVKDLLFTKEKGLINGVSNIFIENLNKLPAVQRPLWCGDKKRRKLYIKADKWTEDIDNQQTKQAINNVSLIQTKNINKYQEMNPNWISNDKLKDEYISIVKNATEPMHNKEENVISRMVDTIYLDNVSKNNVLQ